MMIISTSKGKGGNVPPRPDLILMKNESRRVANSFLLADQEEMSAKVFYCHSTLHEYDCDCGASYDMRPHQRCNSRFCKMCGWYAARKVSGKFRSMLTVLDRAKRLPPYLSLITFDIPNVPGDQVRAAIKDLQQEEANLQHTLAYRNSEGRVIQAEVVINPTTLLFHPHLHVLSFNSQAATDKQQAEKFQLLNQFRSDLALGSEGGVNIKHITAETDKTVVSQAWDCYIYFLKNSYWPADATDQAIDMAVLWLSGAIGGVQMRSNKGIVKEGFSLLNSHRKQQELLLEQEQLEQEDPLLGKFVVATCQTCGSYPHLKTYHWRSGSYEQGKTSYFA